MKSGITELMDIFFAWIVARCCWVVGVTVVAFGITQYAKKWMMRSLVS
jgi:hypothetical protein